MDNVKILVQLFVLITVSILGWLLGHARHGNIPPEDLIYLPTIFGTLFGNNNGDNSYSVRGIYLQIFVIIFALIFGLYIFKILSLYLLSRIFLIVLLVVFPLFEVARAIINKTHK